VGDPWNFQMMWLHDNSGFIYAEATNHIRFGPADGSAHTILRSSVRPTGRLALSPSGTRLAFIEQVPVNDLYIMDIDGTNLINLTDGFFDGTILPELPNNESPSWSLDESSIAILAYSPINFNKSLYIIGVPDGSRTLLYDGDSSSIDSTLTTLLDYTLEAPPPPVERPNPATQPGVYAVYHDGAWIIMPTNILP
jgi:Tol biopolymer transport system component